MSIRTARTSTGSNDNDNVVEIDLAEVGRAIWNRKKLVILLTILGAVIAFGITSLFIHPTYRSSFTAYINNHSSGTAGNVDSLNSGDTVASQTLAQTYASIMVSRPVVKDAMAQVGMSYSFSEISDCITTEVDTNSQLVTLDVTMEDPQEAKNLASAIAKVAPGHIADIVEGSSMKVVASPVLASSPYAPSLPKNTAVGAIIGFLIAIAIIVISELTDDRIKSVEELEKRFGIPVIGIIPSFEDATRNKGNYNYYYKTSASKKN